MLEPERQIQRLGVQQGLFLMPLNIHSSFISNLAENGEKIEGQENDWFKAPKNHFKKIVIADRVRSKALNELTKMNITAESLFPGLDGFARSLVQTILSA